MYLDNSFSFTEISISLSENPDVDIWDIPFRFLRSTSIFFEIFFNELKPTFSAVREKIKVGSCCSIFFTTIGSRLTGNEGTLSTAFFTSTKTLSTSESSRVSTKIYPMFSLDAE